MQPKKEFGCDLYDNLYPSSDKWHKVGVPCYIVVYVTIPALKQMHGCISTNIRFQGLVTPT